MVGRRSLHLAPRRARVNPGRHRAGEPAAGTLAGDAPAGVPAAIVVSGPAGSGKSTLGRLLAARLGYAVADLDAPAGEDEDVPHPSWRRSERYEALAARAEAALGSGRGVVVIAPFTLERGDTASWLALATRLARATVAGGGPGCATTPGGALGTATVAGGGQGPAPIAGGRATVAGRRFRPLRSLRPMRPLTGDARRRVGARRVRVAHVYLDCPRDELVRRIGTRSARRDGDKLADLAAWSAGPATDPPVVAHLAIDAALAPATQLALVLDGLAAGDGTTTVELDGDRAPQGRAC